MPNSRSETERPTIMSRLGTFYRQVPTGLTDDQVMREIAFKILLGPMALRKAEPTVIVHRRRVPDFTGVPGQLASSDEIAGLEFGAKLRKSPYDALLDQLAIAPKGSALKFGDLKCRPSIYSRARKKGLRISFAERGGALFVRFDGRDDDDVRATTRRAAILAALKLGPMSHVKITNKLRDAGDSVLDAAATDAILHQMFKVGQVLRQEGGNWALNPKAAVS